jgi:hypothetical protein
MMDDKQIKDVMLAHGYTLYAVVEDDPRTLVFLNEEHPQVAAHVLPFSDRHIVVFLRALVGMLKIETLDFSIDHPKFHDTYEAQMERALRNMGAWE